MADPRPRPLPAGLRNACAPLLDHLRWLKGLAILNFTLAGLLALTVVGLLLAWFFVWVGHVLWRAVQALDAADRDPDPDRFDAHVVDAMDRIAFHFMMQVALLVVLVGVGLMVSLVRPLL